MTNEQRKELGRLHWTPAVKLWAMGFSARFIAVVMNYKNRQSFIVRKNQLRKKYPDWFPPRPKGFVPRDASFDF